MLYTIYKRNIRIQNCMNQEQIAQNNNRTTKKHADFACFLVRNIFNLQVLLDLPSTQFGNAKSGYGDERWRNDRSFAQASRS